MGIEERVGNGGAANGDAVKGEEAKEAEAEANVGFRRRRLP